MTMKTNKAICKALAATAASALIFLATGCEKMGEGEFWAGGDPGGGGSGGGGGGGTVENVESGDDAVSFGSLKWLYGGYDGSGNTVVDGYLRNVRCNRTIDQMMSTYNPAHHIYGRVDYDRPPSGWTVSKGIFCLFIQRGDGSWTGGKMDWASVDQGKSPNYGLNFHNLPNYVGWNETLPLPPGTKLACVIVEENGKRRTNVATCVAD